VTNFLFVIPIIVIIAGIYLNNNNPKEIIKEIVKNNSDITISDTRDTRDTDIVVHNDEMYIKILNKGELGLAESYMDGDWSSNNLGQFINKLLKHQDIFEEKIIYKAPQLLYFRSQYKLIGLWNINTLVKSPGNIMAHYDVGNDLMVKMLGKTMQYTCAYYNEKDIDLDQAEYNKMELIAKKLDLRPGMKVLDIGCGFGSMAYHLVKNYGVNVTAVTLSQKQVDYGKENYKHKDLTIDYLDYRKVTGKYDRVYSVGIMEHIGSRNYTEYFDKCNELLVDDGVMFFHTMAIAKPNKNQNKYFASTYIFPEGELPDINNITQFFSKDWRLEDFQNIGISYSKTFDAWADNIGDWSGLEHYDAVFRRMWEYYLHQFAENFRYQNFLLWQFVVTKKKHNRDEDCLFIRN